MRGKSVWLVGFLLFAAGAASTAAVLSVMRSDGGQPVRAERAQPEAVTPTPAAARAAEDPLEAAAIAAVRARFALAEGAPGLFELRVHRFGPPDELAVCGLVVGRDGSTAEPFVARVLFSRTSSTALPAPARATRAAADDGGAEGTGTSSLRLRASTPLVVFEEGPGLWRSGLAERRYCRDAGAEPPQPVTAGAPPASPLRSGPAAPAMPPDRRDHATGTDATPPAATAPGLSVRDRTAPAPYAMRTPPAGRVVLRSPAYIRAGPGGNYPIVTTAPGGTVFPVLGHAPGGWVLVGSDGVREAWVHASLLE